MTSFTSKLQESFSFADYQGKAQFPDGHGQDFAPANEEMYDEQYVHHNNAVRYLNNRENRHGKEYLHGKQFKVYCFKVTVNH